MSRTLLDIGDRLISVWTAPSVDGFQQGGTVGGEVRSIHVDQLPGPMGFYLVAVITFESSKADKIIPLHMAQTIEVLNP